MKHFWFTIVMLISTLPVCEAKNLVEKYYTGAPDGRTLPAYDASASTKPIQLFTSNDLQKDTDELLRKGFIHIGESAFHAGPGALKRNDVTKYGEKIGAHLVLISEKLKSSESGVSNRVVPDIRTSVTDSDASAMGSGGFASMSGSSTTTTYGTKVVSVPYTIQRWNYNAVYYIKVKGVLGTYLAPLDDATIKRRQSNLGLRVTAIMDGSPAFTADILKGDIILTIGGEKVGGSEAFGDLLKKYQGQKVRVDLDRDGRAISKMIQLGTY